MTMFANLNLDEPTPGPTDAPSPEEPTVFVRTIVTPPGLPWEQSRVANLEARHGAPLPMNEVLCELRRLDGWRPGGQARFAAFYVLARDIDEVLEASAEVDGEVVPVTFLSPASRRRRSRRVLVTGAVASLVGFTLAVGLGTAVTTRMTMEANLEGAEVRLQNKAHLLQRRQDLLDQTRTLERQPDRGSAAEEVLQDIAWLSENRVQDIQIQALHWTPDIMAIEVATPARPLLETQDRTLRRGQKPLRSGRHLWAVTKSPAGLGAQTPLAALPRDEVGTSGP